MNCSPISVIQIENRRIVVNIGRLNISRGIVKETSANLPDRLRSAEAEDQIAKEEDG